MIQINELVMRVPGMQEEHASHLGREVAELVASELPANSGNRSIPELRVKLDLGALRPGVPMAVSIAEEILREIRLTTYR